MKTTGNEKMKRRAKTTSALDKAINAVVSAGASFTEMVKKSIMPARSLAGASAGKTRSPRKRRQAAA